MSERADISRLRRRAAKLGYRIAKSNWRRDSIDNLGGYQIVDAGYNVVVDGSRFNLEISDVRAWLDDQERKAA